MFDIVLLLRRQGIVGGSCRCDGIAAVCRDLADGVDQGVNGCGGLSVGVLVVT
ncbi:MAG: hypothetical protein V8S89_05830 [Oscillospiraceae bacterium]